MTREAIAAWIRQKDSCCAFQDLSRQVLEDWEGAKATAQKYQDQAWFSEYEAQRLKEFGLLL